MKDLVPPLKAFKVGDAVLDLNYLLNAAFEDIGEAAESIPAAIGWLGYHRSLAMERLIVSEQAWKEIEAKQYFDLKNGGFTAQGFGDKPTEEALKKAVLLTPEVKAACADYAKRKQHVEWMSSSVIALQAKLELVRSSEATRRMEHEPERHRGTAV